MAKKILIIILVSFLTLITDSTYKLPRYNSQVTIKLFVDFRFSTLEEYLLLIGLEEWQKVSEGKIFFQVFWNQPRPPDLAFLKDGTYIWAITENERTSMFSATPWLAGLFIKNFQSSLPSGHILLIHRSNFEAKTYTVLTHEIGHLLGLGHSQNISSIMHPEAIVTCISLEDARKLCNIYGCNPTSSCGKL